MRIAITGYTGFLGKLLTDRLLKNGHSVTGISRAILGDPHILAQLIDQSEILVNLAGANIGKRWTKEYKAEIYNSRIDTTRNLAIAFKLVSNKPRLFISASGVGIYDNQHTHTELSQYFASNFLANLSKDWEYEALKAQADGINTVVLRMGPILDKTGGMLPSLVQLFSRGLGTIMGSGKQPMPWISSVDWLNAIVHIIDRPDSRGIYNIVAPETSNNKQFSKLLAQSLHKPLFMKLPSFLLKLILGENSILVLEGQTVVPKRLVDEGFEFKYRSLPVFFGNIE